MATGDSLFAVIGGSFNPDSTCDFTDRNGNPLAAFDDTTSEDARYSVYMPEHYDDGGLTFELEVMAATAITGDSDWEIGIERSQVGTLDHDADSFAANNVVNGTTVPGTAGVTQLITITFVTGGDMDGWVAGEWARINVGRNTADTASGDMQLLGVACRET